MFAVFHSLPFVEQIQGLKARVPRRRLRVTVLFVGGAIFGVGALTLGAAIAVYLLQSFETVESLEAVVVNTYHHILTAAYLLLAGALTASVGIFYPQKKHG
jgi:hypothetical protein